MSIDIFNPKELPFGPLSNNYFFVMNVEKETYKTVTNFIYSNLIMSPKYFETLKNSSVQEIHDYFTKYDTELFYDVTEEALKIAMEQKLKKPVLIDLLLSTYPYPITYISEDDFLGKTEDGKGKNKLGKYLTDFRNKMYEENHAQSMYDSYVVNEILYKLIIDYENDLSGYMGLDQKEIINKYIHFLGVKRAKETGKDISNLSYQEVIDQYKTLFTFPDKDILSKISIGFGDSNKKLLRLLDASIGNPLLLVLNARKEHLYSLRLKQLSRVKSQIFNIYVDNLIKLNYEELSPNQYDEIKIKELGNTKQILEAENKKKELMETEKNLRQEVDNLEQEIKFYQTISDKEIDFNADKSIDTDKKIIKETEKNLKGQSVSGNFIEGLRPSLEKIISKIPNLEKILSLSSEGLKEYRRDVFKDKTELSEKDEERLRKRYSEELTKLKQEEESLRQQISISENIIAKAKDALKMTKEDRINKIVAENTKRLEELNTKLTKDKEELKKTSDELEKVKSSFLDRTNVDLFEYEIFQNKIYDFYKDGILPENVLETINNTINTSVVSDDEVIKSKSYDIESYFQDNEINKDIEITFESEFDSDNPYTVFSPNLAFFLIEINGNFYPTVNHYILANLISLLPEVRNIDLAHKYLLIDKNGSVTDRLNYEDLQSLISIYGEEKFRQFNKFRKKLSVIALNKKFEDRSLQELLVSTGNNTLVYRDEYDDVLGEGFNEGGENFIGKYLMELRQKFITNEDTLGDITKDDLAKIIKNDEFMRSWVNMRLGDICSVVKEMRNYIRKRHDVRIQIDADFIIKVLDQIYQPCDDLIKDFDLTPDKVDTNWIEIGGEKQTFYKNTVTNEISYEVPYGFKGRVTPSYFEQSVVDCFGPRYTTIPMIELLWKRVVGMIYFILQYVPKLRNVKNIITKVELLVSKKTKCVKIINNEEDNCILSAIINLLKRLIDFNENNKYQSDITRIDVETVTNIILNRGRAHLEDRDLDFYEDMFDYSGETGNDDDDVDVDEQPSYTNYTKTELKELRDVEDIIRQQSEQEEEEEAPEFKDEEEEGDEAEEEEGDEESENDNGRWDEITKEFQLQKENEERAEFKKYKNANKITNFLQENNVFSLDYDKTSKYILDSVEVIKRYKMPSNIKTNRINFFATLT